MQQQLIFSNKFIFIGFYFYFKNKFRKTTQDKGNKTLNGRVVYTIDTNLT